MDGNYSKTDEVKKKLFVVSVNSKKGLINRKGEIIVAPTYDFIDDFYEERAVVKKGNLFGYIDKSGNEIKTPEFDIFFLTMQQILVILIVVSE